MTSSGPCAHIKAITTVKQPRKRVCEECVKIGARWVHLRTCQECGRTLCCDDSPNRHATAHQHATEHAIIRSLQPGEDWCWCYLDEIAFVVDGITGHTRIPPSPLGG